MVKKRNIMEKPYDLWAKRNPQWETRYEKKLLCQFTDYGRGLSQYQDARGRSFSAGYELYIIAFFIGLYANQTKSLVEDASKCKGFGQQIQYWGNLDSRTGRKSYSEIRKHIFAALIAKTNIDLIALEKGELEASDVVSTLTDAMNEYANYGFYYLAEKLKDNPNFLYRNSGFLDIFLDLTRKKQPKDEELEEL